MGTPISANDQAKDLALLESQLQSVAELAVAQAEQIKELMQFTTDVTNVLKKQHQRMDVLRQRVMDQTAALYTLTQHHVMTTDLMQQAKYKVESYHPPSYSDIPYMGAPDLQPVKPMKLDIKTPVMDYHEELLKQTMVTSGLSGSTANLADMIVSIDKATTAGSGMNAVMFTTKKGQGLGKITDLKFKDQIKDLTFSGDYEGKMDLGSFSISQVQEFMEVKTLGDPVVQMVPVSSSTTIKPTGSL